MEGSTVADPAWGRVGRFPALGLYAWCGLVSGLAEVATVIVHKRAFDPNQLYEMSRHFVWLIPLTNLCIFVWLGVTFRLLARAAGRAAWTGWHLGCSVRSPCCPRFWLPYRESMDWLVFL